MRRSPPPAAGLLLVGLLLAPPLAHAIGPTSVRPSDERPLPPGTLFTTDAPTTGLILGLTAGAGLGFLLVWGNEDLLPLALATTVLGGFLGYQVGVWATEPERWVQLSVAPAPQALAGRGAGTSVPGQLLLRGQF